MKLLKNKKALSTVVTTLIVLVVSVLLATVVTFYAINVTTTRVQEESLQITKLHIWCDNGGNSSAAFMITNTGGRDAVMEKITIRGVKIDGSEIFYWKIGEGDTVPDELVWVNGTQAGFQEAYGEDFTNLGTDSLVLPSGARMVVYLFNLAHLSTSDIGVSVSVVVFTANAQYYKETNVEAYLP
ncbi:MAG: hypothetical protein QXZ51_00170 [Candidatus Bathyarchaeia archaeon]